MQNLPIVSPRGHTQAAWCARDDPANCLYNPTITFTGCYTVRESRWRIWKSDVRKSSIPRQSLADSRGPLFPLPRNPDAHVVGFCLPRTFRIGGTAVREVCRFLLRQDSSKTRDPGVFATGSLLTPFTWKFWRQLIRLRIRSLTARRLENRVGRRSSPCRIASINGSRNNCFRSPGIRRRKRLSGQEDEKARIPDRRWRAGWRGSFSTVRNSRREAAGRNG